VLGVGIDWAQDGHVVAMSAVGDGGYEMLVVPHRPSAVDGLVARIAMVEPDPSQVRVTLEISHGALVERLLDAGFVVMPVNPDLVARRRGPAKKKDDNEDARILCRLALDCREPLRALRAPGAATVELRSIARDDERAAGDERRLLNRLRADLLATFPAALALGGEELGRPTLLRLLQRWPTAKSLAAASRDEVMALAREGFHGWPGKFADDIKAALSEDHFPVADHVVAAKADTIRVTAAQLLLLGAQRRAWERRLGELLGARRGGNCAEAVVPGGEIYRSFPGLGDRLAARVAGEIGVMANFATANGLQAYAGKAPVTRRSGRSQYIVTARQACNGRLRDAVQLWAFCSISLSGWAREYYAEQRRRRKGHHAALRALGNRWLEVLWFCVTRGIEYDEDVHVQNRNRALARAAA
jgi:transposase